MKLGQKFTRCKRCHRKLKTEEAQKRGYGAHCFQQYLAENRKKNKTLLDMIVDIKMQNKNTKN